MPVILKGRKPVIYVYDSDLTDNGRASDPEFGHQPVDVTTFNDSARRIQPGLQTVSYSYNGLFDSSSQKSHAAIVDLIANKRTVTVFPQGDASGSSGIGLSNARAENYALGGAIGDVEELGCNIVQDGTYDIVYSLGTKSTSTADATLTQVDGTTGATATAGGAMYVHVFANQATGGTDQWIVRLQHSGTSGTNFSDRATFTVGSGTTLGTRVAFTGTLLRFRRAVYDLNGTGGTLVAQASYVVPK